jgi:hypothetical protein
VKVAFLELSMTCACTIRKLVAALVLALFAAALVAPAARAQDASQLDLKIDTSGGYARLVFPVGDDIEANARLLGNVLIVEFSKPVMIDVDRIAAGAPDYMAAARLDPDGRALRIALVRKIKLNSIMAGEKFFLDLLPEDWSGGPPSLPQDVIDDLARRAREAERLERLERRAQQQKKPAPVRVRVASQPTFTRFLFDVSDQVAVSSDRAAERLTLSFQAPIAFDFGDVDAALPATVAAIKSEVEKDSTLVRFSLAGKVDVRTFRDGGSYDVDVVRIDDKAENAPAAAKAAARPAAPAPVTPAELAAAAAPVPPAVSAPAAMAPKPATPAASPASAAKPQAERSAAVAPAPPAVSAPSVGAPKPAATAASPASAAKPQAQPAAPAAASNAAPAVPPAAATAARPSAMPAAKLSAATAPQAAAPRQRVVPMRRQQKPDTVAVGLSRQGPNLKLTFAFTAVTAAAVFQRADTLWIVFDSPNKIDLSALTGEASRTIRGADFTHAPDAAIVRIRLDRPRLSSAIMDGPVWTVTVGDSVPDPSHALEIARNLIAANRASATIPFLEPHQLHRIADPEIGDQLFVVTGFTPIRGFINAQDFVEFHTLASTQGIAVVPLADDLEVALAADKVVISRPGGLALSNSLQGVLRGSNGLRPLMFDAQLWGRDRQSTYEERQSRLIAVAAAAPPAQRLSPQLDLARFYVARGMYAEAKGVLDVALSQERPAADDVAPSVLRAVAEIMMNRPDDALKDLARPEVGDQHDAPLWRALAYARQGRWAQARDEFRSVEAAIATLPLELQRVALKEEMRAAIEVGDLASAADRLNDFETIGIPHDMQPEISVLAGRLSEALGHSDDALAAYRAAADSWDRPAAAQARLRETLLRYALGDLKRTEVINALEALTTVWRGDDTEVEALQVLARLYTEEGRYRDSFYVTRSAIAAHPNSDLTRRIQEEAAATFESLFLGGKGDALPTVEALALFYDFRDLVPIDSRGDEMIRRLADRLVSVDLLDQAAELLQYQVDHRLQGAARAQVATRLAVIYLLNHKADRALAVLRATRLSDVSDELRNQRLLLEARAISDLGRYDLALDIVAHVEGREAIRLRSDIYWAARRWRQSAEQIELYYGDRWKQWQPLNDVERADIMRAAIGYALADDSLGLSRFREKYAAKMTPTPDARAFEVVTAQLGTDGAEFRDIARAAASIDTLEGFLRDLKARYPEASSAPSVARALPDAPAAPFGPPATRPATAAPSIPGAGPARAAGHTAQR